MLSLQNARFPGSRCKSFVFAILMGTVLEIETSLTRIKEKQRLIVRVVLVMRVEALCISPGHNFFGHHGKPAGQHPALLVPRIECVAGLGIRGDRFFDYQKNDKSHITFFAMEVFEALRRELSLPEAQPEATRRNAFVRGVDLNALIGKRFKIQGVQFQGVEESKPCYWMDQALGPGAEAWLHGRGGLRCRILSGGVLRCHE